MSNSQHVGLKTVQEAIALIIPKYMKQMNCRQADKALTNSQKQQELADPDPSPLRMDALGSKTEVRVQVD